MNENEIEVSGQKFKAAPPQKDGLCYGCAFYEELSALCDNANQIQSCTPWERDDAQHIIWVRA